MSKRLPLIPTVIVALALAAMLGLGVWQLQRAQWKESLLTRLVANRDLPPITYPTSPAGTDDILFRQASGVCSRPKSIRATAGRDAAGTSGWSYIATCADSRAGPGMIVDIGWLPTFGVPVSWAGGPVAGVIAPDSKATIRLVAVNPAPGLRPSQPPGIDTIPNNHRVYATQWFFFAAAAALIYGITLRHRWMKPKA